MTSLNPQVDNHLNNELDEILENYGGIAPIGEYRHTYNCPDRKLEAPSCPCLTQDQFEQAILNIINQEKAKLVDLISKEVGDEKLKEWRTIPSGQTVQNKDAHNFNVGLTTAQDILNRIKQEEGLK